MCKEYKVQIVRGEDDNYNELWKVVGEEKYVCRHTYKGFGTWYSVCDPLGYCELNDVLSDDIVFIICDDDGNELFRNSNGGKPFPKFETVIKSNWEKVSKEIVHNVEDFSLNFWAEAWNGDTTMKINQWLLSFKDPELYPEKANDYDENWTGCWAEKEIAYEPIPNTEFSYLGNKYQFTKVIHKHDYCGVEWTEYVCTDSPYKMQDTPWVKDRQWIQSYMYLGNSFDESIQGTMYDKRTARNKIVEKLIKVYPPKNKFDKLLYVVSKTNSYHRDVCYERSYSDVADALIGKDFHRKNVDRLYKFVRSETVGKVFCANRKGRYEVKEKYPDVYGYDCCLY